MPSNHSYFSDETFDRIINLLISDSLFRKQFYADAELAVREAGIPLTSDEIKSLHNIRCFPHDKYLEMFDERLVLCSSSGY